MINIKELNVGYGKEIIIEDINLHINEGEIITLIGPNGSGKSTILKTITKQLKSISGSITVLDKDIINLKEKEIAQYISMVMTERIKPLNMTCRDIVCTGRYPYTGKLGILSENDNILVDEAIKLVHAEEVALKDFSKVSDGQKQRIMLARAICQNTKIIVLDEPTSYLDMYYKIDLLKTIYKLAKEQNKVIIMSLHELDLVKAISDTIICVKDRKIAKIGSSKEIFTGTFIQRLYGVNDNDFNPDNASINIIFNSKSKLKSEQKEIKATNKRHAKIIMVQGTMSNAGKSLIVAGLCRVLKQDGYRVAPFKSQNMALNSFITKEGLEMGRAQVMQAEASGIEPMVCMNPILLKPTTDQGSQVIVNGVALGNMSARDYFKYKKDLIPEIIKAFNTLEQYADVIVIEGAGSPAEINLRKDDIVNMGLAELLDAPVILVGDIDRGGVFAQLLGTIQLLSEEEKKRVKGLVINKFRGDKTILDPGIQMLEDKAKLPVIGVLPYINIHIDDEDSLSTRFNYNENKLINIGIIKLPRISNFTDFSVFEQIEDVAIHYISDTSKVENMDLIILPGSKNTIADLKWLRESGLEAAIKKYSQNNYVFGICGGFQMLGKTISDPYNVEEGGIIRGLELLEIDTVMSKEKTRIQVNGVLKDLEGLLEPINNNTYSGYEIHMGKSFINGKEINDKVIIHDKNIYGTYVHGFFDEGNIAFKIVEAIATKKGIKLEGANNNYKEYKQKQYDILADTIRNYMDMDKIYSYLNEANISGE